MKEVQINDPISLTKQDQPAEQMEVMKLLVKEDIQTAGTGLNVPQKVAVSIASDVIGEGKKLKVPQVEYTLPNICCRCGKKGKAQKFQNSVFKGKKHTYLLSSKRFEYIIILPLCATCFDKDVRLEEKVSKNTVIGAIIGGFLGFVIVGLQGVQDMRIMFIAAMFGALICGFLGRIFSGSSNLSLGSFNGRRYVFRNKDFQRKFEELNPHWKNLSDLII